MTTKKSSAVQAGVVNSTPVSISKPRIPLPAGEIQYNFCKNPKCSNYGVEPPSTATRGVKGLYALTAAAKGFPLLKCNCCGEMPPLKSNIGIFEEVERLSKYLKKDALTCPNVECGNYIVPVGTPKAYASFGKTKQGAKRYRCNCCNKTFSVPLPTQYQHETHKNKDIFSMLVNKVPLSRIVELTGISWEVLYHRIDFIYNQCVAFAGNRESQLKDLPLEKLYLSVDRQDHYMNWSEREDKRNIVLSALASADNNTGFVFGFHSNFDPTLDRDEIEQYAQNSGDINLPSPHRRYARLWLETDYKQSSFNSSKSNKKGETLSEIIDTKYQTAQEREDVEASYEMTCSQKLPNYGMQTHSEYTMIGHFYFLKKLLPNVDKWRFFLDQDSGIRASVLSAFKDDVINKKCEAFYVSIKKDFTIDDKRLAKSDADEYFNDYAKANPQLSAFEVKLEILKDHINAASVFGSWKDKWVRHPTPSMSEPMKAMCWLTEHNSFSDDHVALLHDKASLHGVDSFFQKCRRRMSMFERAIHTSSSDGRTWTGYAPYNPARAVKLLEIFRVFHNYIHVPEKPKNAPVGWKKDTPAMRIGLAKAPLKYEDVLYYQG